MPVRRAIHTLTVSANRCGLRDIRTRYPAPCPVRPPGRRAAILPAVPSVRSSAEPSAPLPARLPAPPICLRRRPAAPDLPTITGPATRAVRTRRRSVRVADEDKGRTGHDRGAGADEGDIGVADLT